MAQPLAEDIPVIVIRSTFKYFDKDNSGCLDTQEFTKYLKSLGFNEEERDAFKGLTDNNADNKITLDEFIEFYKGDKVKNIVENNEEFEFLCTCKEIFNEYDKNGDGKITWDEWQKALKDKRDDKEIKSMFEAADKNNDKTITFDEFYKGIVGE